MHTHFYWKVDYYITWVRVWNTGKGILYEILKNIYLIFKFLQILRPRAQADLEVLNFKSLSDLSVDFWDFLA